jgi:hypothetical protein
MTKDEIIAIVEDHAEEISNIIHNAVHEVAALLGTQSPPAESPAQPATEQPATGEEGTPNASNA